MYYFKKTLSDGTHKVYYYTAFVLKEFIKAIVKYLEQNDDENMFIINCEALVKQYKRNLLI